MAILQERLNKVGNVLAMEYRPDRRYCRQILTVTYAGNPAMEVGEVITDEAGTGATWTPADGAGFAAGTSKAAVVIDDQVEEKIEADLALGSPVGTVDLACLVRGPAQVKRVGLNFTTATQQALIEAELVGAGIDILDKYSVKTASRLS